MLSCSPVDCPNKGPDVLSAGQAGGQMAASGSAAQPRANALESATKNEPGAAVRGPASPAVKYNGMDWHTCKERFLSLSRPAKHMIHGAEL